MKMRSVALVIVITVKYMFNTDGYPIDNGKANRSRESTNISSTIKLNTVEIMRDKVAKLTRTTQTTSDIHADNTGSLGKVHKYIPVNSKISNGFYSVDDIFEKRGLNPTNSSSDKGSKEKRYKLFLNDVENNELHEKTNSENIVSSYAEEVFSESEVDISEKNSNDDRNSGAAGNYDTNTDEGDDVQNDDTAGVEKPRVEIRVSVMKRSGRFWEPWELNNNVCPPSLCTSNDENVRPRGTGGSVFYNGDIVLDSESSKIIFSNDIMLPYRRKRATMRSSRTWIGGVVPYVFADDINPKSKRIINKAMKEIENKTCINFRSKKGKDSDYIRFISEPGCWSSVGKVGGEQKVSIGLGCERLGTAIHEISHALGFWHEQARPDRDGYVKILEENISPRYLPDFRKADPALVSSRGYPYDYESVMHYSERAFTNLGEKTIEVIGVGQKLKMKIGQRDELSNIDIAQLRDMYHCNDKKDDNDTYCPDGWQKHGRSCYRFEAKMAEQFSGAARYCEGLKSKLLHINDEREDLYIQRTLKKKYKGVKVWRTGGRSYNGTFQWHNGDAQMPDDMTYTKWEKGHPATYSSLALVYDRKNDSIRWQGVWLGSQSQLPEHAYPFICERRARRKCIKGQYTDGRDYRGTLDHTVDGHTCQKWTSRYPHDHNLLPYQNTIEPVENKDGLGDHNFCRNPSNRRRSRPWCYTTKKNYTWQYCDVSVCSKKLQADDNVVVKNKILETIRSDTNNNNNSINTSNKRHDNVKNDKNDNNGSKRKHTKLLKGGNS